MTKAFGSVGIYTLGCKVNQYESEAIAEACSALGLEVRDATEVCDAYIINTCTVTSEADRKARQFIRRARSENPYAFIVVTGCLAQVNPKSIADIDGVDHICGNSNKLEAANAVYSLIKSRCKNPAPCVNVSPIDDAGFEKMSISSFGRTRACIKIEDGCESHCAYCIIPSARGKIRSKRPEDVLAEIKTLTEAGCREVVLTGIETASYGRDLDGVDLASLLCAIDNIHGIGRVRLGSLDPSLFKPEFIERIAGLRSLAPHFHMSLQSGSSRVLALMKRKYNADTALRAIEDLRRAIPDVMFTTDVIVGFPQESDEDFAETLAFADAAQFLMIHVFPYSRRAGTVADRMPGQISEEVKRLRSASLINKQSEIKANILKNVIIKRPAVDVLFETFENGYAYGHTDNFIEVKVGCDSHPGHNFRRVLLDGTDGKLCTGQIAD